MEASIAVIGILAAFVIGFFVGRFSKSQQSNENNGDNKKPPTRFESAVKTGLSTDGTHSFSIKNISDLNWYDSYVLILKDDFTMESARVFGIGRKRWEKIKKLLITNDLLTECSDRTVHPPTQLARKKIRELLVQSNKQINWDQVHRLTIVPKVQSVKLDPKEGWITFKKPPALVG